MKRSIRPFIFILCFFIAFSISLIKSGNSIDASQEKIIRVALYHDVCSLSSSGSKESIQVSALRGLIFGYVANGTFNELYSSSSGERYTVKCSTDSAYGIQLYNGAGQLLLTFDVRNGDFQARPMPENDPMTIRLQDYYRGIMEFRRFPNYSPGYLTVINEVNIEEYLYGVVPKEIGYEADFEALKAQAVAARSYAYKHLETPKSPYSYIDTHLSDSSDCQVYYGYAVVNRVTGSLIMVEQQSTNAAVNATRGQALKYNGEYIYAFFSASNGGYTEASENVWGGTSGYLKARPDPYELTTSSRYYWQRTFTSSELRAIVKAESGYTRDIGEVSKVEILERADSGRPTHVMLTGTNGTYSIYNSSCRTAFGLNGQLYDIVNNNSLSNAYVVNGYDTSVRSVSPAVLYVMNSTGIIVKVSKESILNGAYTFRAFSNVSSISDGFTFIGRGWGHGVGLSQEGAKGMAQMGFDYLDILEFYYPGTYIN